MDKNILYPAISVIIVVVVAAGIYVAAQGLGGTTPHGEEEELQFNVDELFFGAVEKPLGVGDYTYSYEETQNSGYRTEITVSRKGNLSYVYKKDPVSERYGYFEGDESIVCIKYKDEEKCVHIENNTAMFAPYALSLKTLLYDDASTRAMAEHYRKLSEYGGIVFSDEVEERTINGHDCVEIEYTVDYSVLTVAQLNEIGMSADDPALLRAREYGFSMCIDPETGDMYEKRVEFTNLGVEDWMQSETKSWDWGSGMDVEKPAELVEEGELYGFYQNIMKVAEDYLACLEDSEKGRCMAELAVSWENIEFCEEAGEYSDFCLINTGLAEGKPEVCMQVSPEMRDTCNIEFANSLKDVSYCSRIVNATIKEQCLALNFTGASGSCSTDSDCVRAGCSSQLCVPASEAEDVVTTCEYLPEYACLAQTTCGCVEGECRWRETPEYLNCLNQTMG